MDDIADRVPAALRDRLRPAPIPLRVTPMLATLSGTVPTGPGWLFERKLDGVRILGFRDGNTVRLRTRNDLDATARFPEVAVALSVQDPTEFVVDGEVVAFDGTRTSFEQLQHRMQRDQPTASMIADVPVFFYAFDLLQLNGYDCTALPLRARKALLKKCFRFVGPIRFSTHRTSGGPAYFEHARTQRWEGIVAKRADAPYVQKRSRDWLKLKCTSAQELVVGGWTDPQGSRTGFGALLVGYYDGDDLVYAGRVGTGFTHTTIAALEHALRDRAVATSPFTRGAPPRKECHWVRPELVTQVGFTEWTREGLLRHPRFLGMRDDRAAHDVVREPPG